MTNATIIYNDALSIYEQEALDAFINSKGFLPLNTYARWQKLGYQVKKSEHAKMMARLWKMKRNVNVREAQEAQENNETTEEQMQAYFYKVNAFLFDISQVEKIVTA